MVLTAWSGGLLEAKRTNMRAATRSAPFRFWSRRICGPQDECAVSDPLGRDQVGRGRQPGLRVTWKVRVPEAYWLAHSRLTSRTCPMEVPMDGRHVRRNWSLVSCMVLASVVLAPAASAAESRSESRSGHCVA